MQVILGRCACKALTLRAMETKTKVQHSTDNCYLEYVEGYLACTYNHKIGEECLMNREEKCELCDGDGFVEEYGDGANFEYDVIGTHPCPRCT